MTIARERTDPVKVQPPQQVAEPPFASFWMGGFESASHINRAGVRVDMIAATQHDRLAQVDYGLLRDAGIRTAREGFRWHLVEATPGRYNFASAQPIVDAADRHRIQVVWTLLHYGWPDDLDLLGPDFVPRFAAFAREAARFLGPARHGGPRWYAPVNEISFLSWAAGEVGYIHPFHLDRGWEVKCQLVRAALAATDAIREVDPDARFLHCDPLIGIIPPAERPDLQEEVDSRNRLQYQAWDMITGRLAPELGGAEHYLDVVGANFYHANIWEWPEGYTIWEQRRGDPRWPRFHQLLDGLHRRYRRPILVAETSHFGSGRAAWLSYVAEEVEIAIRAGVPLSGICLYPVIDRPDWDNPDHWHHSGIWDLSPDHSGTLIRRPCPEYLGEFHRLAHRWRQASA